MYSTEGGNSLLGNKGGGQLLKRSASSIFHDFLKFCSPGFPVSRLIFHDEFVTILFQPSRRKQAEIVCGQNSSNETLGAAKRN